MRIATIQAVVVLLCCAGPATAQLCQGSLGDPIVNRTFGAGVNPGPPLAAATTNYQYVPQDCPGDGYYTLINNTSSCFANTWHSLATDHTGDPGGYFMLVNASIQPGVFYLDTAHGLCGNTTYEFAAWVLNILRPTACGSNGTQPNLTFSIEKTDGTILQSYNTGNIPTQPGPAWQQVGFFFTTGSGVTDVVVRIVNNSPGGCGNDLALDDITFKACGPQLTASIAGNASNTVSFCEGNARSFIFTCAVSPGFNNPSFQWQQRINGANWTDIPGAITTSFSKNFPSTQVPGVYEYRLSAAETGNMSSLSCRVVSGILTITIVARPSISISSNAPICEKGTLLLNAAGGTQYQWNGPDNFLGSGPAVVINDANPGQSGRYYVVATNAAGCSATDSVDVNIHPRPVAFILFNSATICESGQIQLSGGGGTVYHWIPSTNLSSAVIPDPIASPADTITYMLIVSNNFACSDTTQVLVNVIEKPRADAGPDKVVIAGSTAQLSGHVSGQDISYSWSPVFNMTNAQSLHPVVLPAADMDYVLTVVSNAGCGNATDLVHVFVYKDVFVPTAFTPNGDGLNDTWSIPALGAFNRFEVAIFNRWGEIVFQAKNINKAWDGRHKGMPQPAGAYVYSIRLEGQERLLKGTLILVR